MDGQEIGVLFFSDSRCSYRHGKTKSSDATGDEFTLEVPIGITA